jgi:hypothetical protein
MMNTQTGQSIKVSFLSFAALLIAAGCIEGCFRSSPVAATSTLSQATYATPEEAGAALQFASTAGDHSSLSRILGPRSESILNSGDAREDKTALQSFAAKFNRMNRWVAMTDGSRVLYIGADNYPFPIPLAQGPSSTWHFDTPAGEQEILARRIGKNELLAIDTTAAIANAEESYRKASHEYTAKIVSTPGRQDGLYWEVPASHEPSPLGRLDEFHKLDAASSLDGVPVFDGYSFRILTAQDQGIGDSAKNYMRAGKMTEGFAVLATPVKYQDSGIMSFLISRDGVVYQKNLGVRTHETASAIESYAPADGWTIAE